MSQPHLSIFRTYSNRGRLTCSPWHYMWWLVSIYLFYYTSVWCCLQNQAGFEPKSGLYGLWPQSPTPPLSLVDSLSLSFTFPSPTHSFTHTHAQAVRSSTLMYRAATPWFQWKMMDERDAYGGLTVLFTWEVSRFPGCSEMVQRLAEFRGRGAAFINHIRTPNSALEFGCQNASELLWSVRPFPSYSLLFPLIKSLLAEMFHIQRKQSL